MSVNLMKAAQDRETRTGRKYTPDEWIDLQNVQEIVDALEVLGQQGLEDGNGEAYKEFLAARGCPNTDVLDIACFKMASAAAHMMETEVLPNAKKYLNENGDINTDGMWRLLQLTTIASFQFGFEYGVRHGREVSEENNTVG